MTMLHARQTDTVAELGPTKYTIGVSKKCCPFCWDLGQILRTEYHLNFVLPGDHSVYSPWIPPPLGLSDDVLRQLEVVLLQRLKDMLNVPHDRSHLMFLGPSESDDSQNSGVYDDYLSDSDSD
ncbi:hypothetical protein EIP91_005771 [Steccherinum ochraceum]|uniref:Uncharacterized protein n=1 Tax=Steccherinum ochraceum TaxID=92696 RepID=A0A4R0R6U5_9APHY|nr:hypothetical protein EIP91_005771 [Steccherinum ochraceum]